MAKGAKTGGRVKGTPNKSRVNAVALAEELDVDPIRIMLLVAKGDWKSLGYDSPVRIKVGKGGEAYEEDVITLSHRLTACSDVAQYLYPKLKNIDHRLTADSEGIGFRVIVEDYTTKKVT